MELQTVYFTRDWRTGIKRWAGVYFWKLWCHHHLQKLLLLAWSSCQSSPMTWRQLLHGKGCLLIKLQNCSIKYLTGSYLPWKAATLLRNVKIIVIPVTVTHIVQQQQGSLYLEWLRFALNSDWVQWNTAPLLPQVILQKLRWYNCASVISESWQDQQWHHSFLLKVLPALLVLGFFSLSSISLQLSHGWSMFFGSLSFHSHSFFYGDQPWNQQQTSD